MQFNSDKFDAIRYGPSKDESNCNTPYLSDKGITIIEKDHVNDLGIVMSKNIDFGKHISGKVDAIRSKIAWVLRTFRTRNKSDMLSLWKSLILCDHDYACQLWSPTRTGDIQSIELLQRSFL